MYLNHASIISYQHMTGHRSTVFVWGVGVLVLVCLVVVVVMASGVRAKNNKTQESRAKHECACAGQDEESWTESASKPPLDRCVSSPKPFRN